MINFIILWGNIITDAAFQTNYWFSFPNSNSDVIIGLTMWQYWWWFWFTYYMCLYYFIFLRLIRHRVLKFSPKIVTSQKSHGKWGDFIVCLVPIAWCVNILSNSNFILRMMEWQTESSLFTVRIRGRQWYWVYKIELKDLFNIKQTSKNVGHDYWEMTVNNSSTKQIQNLNNIQLKNHNKEYLNRYKSAVGLLANKNRAYSNTITAINNKKNSFSSNYAANNSYYFFKNNPISAIPVWLDFKEAQFRANMYESDNNDVGLLTILALKKSNVTFSGINLKHNSANLNKRMLRAHNYTLLPYTSVLNNLKLNWNSSGNYINTKTTTDNMYFVIKQKRFAAPIKKIATIDITKNVNHFSLKNFGAAILSNEQNYTRKWSAKRLKYKSPVIPLAYNRRLLRTKRVLVLPSQINITLITNSFDVVHSWYIPGLGIKLDCIPGRSTHHTLFIDHAGFYYGQCAEICGRYHHHMPIRVCALPFEHFLIWWYHYGLPFFNATTTNRKTSIKSGIRQYNW